MRNGPKQRKACSVGMSRGMKKYWKKWRAKRGIRKSSVRRLCKCGCGKRVRLPGQSFVNAHNSGLIFKNLWKTKWKDGKGKVSVETRKKMSLASKRRWENPIFRKQQSKVRSKANRKNWKDPEYARNILKSHVHPSRPQVALFKSLCRRGFKGIRLEHYVGKKPIDIAYLPKKIAIEVDGKYWHSKTKLQDRKRDRFFKRMGWKVIRIDAATWKKSKVWENLN